MRLFLFLFCITKCFGQFIGEDNNQFALALFSELDKKEDNLAFSPYGIFSNLSLAYFGAEGATKKQMKSALHLSQSDDKVLSGIRNLHCALTKKTETGYTLNIANGLFPNKGSQILPSFLSLAQNDFNAKVEPLNFAKADKALNSINSWVSKQTNDKISALLKPSDLSTEAKMLLLNAVYFQGEWVNPFSPRMTEKMPFCRNNKTLNVDTLKQTHYFPYYENDRLQLCTLAFERHETDQPFLEFVIILPKLKNGLHKIEKSLSPSKIGQWMHETKSTFLDLHVPKFCFSSKMTLDRYLKKLGVKDAFSYKANFSRINGMKDLFLSKVLHETYFSFQENGVTAASATASSIGVKALPPREETTTNFHADHPFLFLIVDYHSKAILFMGRVTNPTIVGCDEN